jgi:hypothetical protein
MAADIPHCDLGPEQMHQTSWKWASHQGPVQVTDCRGGGVGRSEVTLETLEGEKRWGEQRISAGYCTRATTAWRSGGGVVGAQHPQVQQAWGRGGGRRGGVGVLRLEYRSCGLREHLFQEPGIREVGRRRGRSGAVVGSEWREEALTIFIKNAMLAAHDALAQTDWTDELGSGHLAALSARALVRPLSLPPVRGFRRMLAARRGHASHGRHAA